MEAMVASPARRSILAEPATPARFDGNCPRQTLCRVAPGNPFKVDRRTQGAPLTSDSGPDIAVTRAKLPRQPPRYAIKPARSARHLP
jgi:hypothetical protein